jgi:hypothetical protein
VVIAVLLFGLTISALYTSFLMGRIATYRARYQAQAVNLLQASLEQLAVGAYDNVQDQGPTDITIDPGLDLEWGTGDDLIGQLRIEVEDRMDLDGDGDTDEEEIDLDGDGTNDPCKPVHVSLTWMCLSFGTQRPVTVSLDTLIAER